MKKTVINVIVLALLSSTGFTQGLAITKNIAEKSISKTLLKEQESYPICGTPILIPKEQEIIDYFREHPEERTVSSLAKPAWDFNIGDNWNWWASSWVTNDYYLVESTCRAVGENCYIFVADSVWQEGFVDQDAVDAIVDGFDNTTPNFATQGIYDVDVATFGEPPNIDGDAKIVILILNIQDGYDGTGGYVAGYFSSGNQMSTNDNPNSNEAEIFYMDSFPANLLTPSGRNQVLNTTAHEFQHMIHHRWDENETTFPNEGLSEIASYVCGYGFRNDSGYRDNTNVYLFNWNHDDALPDYTRAALWTLYLLEQYPNGFLKMLVQAPNNAQDGINQALSNYGATRNWQEVFVDWLIANYLQNISVNPKWGYAYPNSIASKSITEHTSAKASGNGNVTKVSGQYVTFKTSIPDTITFTGSSKIKIKVIKIGANTLVEDVTKGIPYIVKPNSETYTDVTFCIYRNSVYDIDSGDYSYTAKGIDMPIEPGNYELSYDDGVPEGTLTGYASGDSIAVRFDGIAGGKLDSIKTIFSGAGRIKLDISKFDGTNFLRGEALMTPMSLNVTVSTDWVVTKLTIKNIDASSDFVVSYLLGNDPYEPCVTVSQEPDDGSANSFSYRNNSDDWVRYTGAGDTIWKYMIRAYVSVGGTTVAIDQDGIVTIPEEFSLEQNYPNPFNPSTTFRFSTPKDGLVKFTVHDLLGRVVYSENRSLFAGNYSFTWEGNNMLNQQVVSGVYFLRMEAEGFIQTRKMLLLR